MSDTKFIIIFPKVVVDVDDAAERRHHEMGRLRFVVKRCGDVSILEASYQRPVESHRS